MSIVIATKPLEFCFLGGFQVSYAGRALRRLRYDKTRALLAYLALESARAPLTRTHLAQLFWPQVANEVARGNLRRTLHDLRQALCHLGACAAPTQWLVADKHCIGLGGHERNWIDVEEFVAAAMPSDASTQDSIKRIEQRLALYRGDFLQDLSLADAPDFSAWLLKRRTTAKQQFMVLLRSLANYQVMQGHMDQASATLERALMFDSCAEDIHCELMRVLARTGRNAAALEQFSRCRSALQSELGSAPSAQTLALARAIRRGEFAFACGPDPVIARDSRRQRVCVLACELRGTVLRDEAASDAMLDVHGALSDIASNHGGYGVSLHATSFLAYFGYPQVHEHAAYKALEATLDLLQHAALPKSPQMRIGVHYDWLVHDPRFLLPDASGTATRQARNIARQARWGQAIISPYLAQQTAGSFEIDALANFGGIAGHIVRGRKAIATRSKNHAKRVTPFVGRDAELSQLRTLWQRSRQGTMQTLLIRAEAGMGKSRLVHGFQQEIIDARGVVHVLRCLPDYRSTPFHPCVALLEGLLEQFVAESGQTHSGAQCLDNWLHECAAPLVGHFAAYSALLRLPQTDEAELFTRQERRHRIDLGLLDLFDFLAWQNPTLFVIEDLHWADATTLAWLQRWLAQTSAPGLLLACSRDSAEQVIAMPVLRLAPLPAGHARQLVRKTAPGLDIAADVLARILERADGVPLYLEEIARLLDKDLPDEIPATLWNLLASRLEAAGSAKRLAQQAAVIGRFFNLDLLRALWDGAAEEVDTALDQLCAARLIQRRADAAVFCHELLRDTASEMLHPAELKQVHARLAELYQGAFRNMVRNSPERLAQHLAAAGQSHAAARTWLHAGLQAADNSMYQEAIVHFQAAIAVLGERPGEEATGIQLQLALGNIWLALHGYGAQQAKECFSRATALSRGAQDDPLLFSAMWGLWLGGRSCTEQEYPLALVHRLERIARISGKAEHWLHVHYAYGNNLFWLARYQQAYTALEQAIALGARMSSAELIHGYGENTLVSARAFMAWVHWAQGRPRTARAAIDATVAMARQTRHANTLCFALTFSIMLHRFMHESGQAAQQAQELAVVAKRHDFALWQAAAIGVAGWAEAMLGDKGGLGKITNALESARCAMSAVEPSFAAMQVDALLQLGAYDECMVQAEQAIALCEKHHDFYYVPELWHLRAKAMLRSEKRGKRERATEARMCLARAIELAAEQGAHTLELRAIRSLLAHTRSAREAARLRTRINALLAACPELPSEKE